MSGDGNQSLEKVKATSSHPTTEKMVNTAIKDLNDRGGSSLKAIAKYMSANYPIDMDKYMPYVKRYLKKSLSTGDIVKTKGTGLNGSFKLAKKAQEAKKLPTKNISNSEDKKGTVKKRTGTKKKVAAIESTTLKKIRISLPNGTVIQRKSLGMKGGMSGKAAKVAKVGKEKNLVAKKKVSKTKSIEASTSKEKTIQPKKKSSKTKSASTAKIKKVKVGEVKAIESKSGKSTKKS